MKKSGYGLTKSKALRGMQKADVSNSGIRNILYEVSIKKHGQITEKEMKEVEDFFEWKCPYTGRDLRKELQNGNHDDVNLDHIVPQNKKYCGLNVPGNVVWVDKKANQKKRSLNVQDFFDKYGDFCCGGIRDEETIAKRIKKIEEWQKKKKYDPVNIQKNISKELENIYNKISKNQNNYIKDISKKI